MRGRGLAGSEHQEKDELIEAILKVLRLDPHFTKVEERGVKRILRKLDRGDLVYLANVFESFAEWIEENCPRSG
ncbi:MAG: hypothetical protein DRK00_02620 [Thermoprotei archaeon]|nr:MAG: hypothetical protein DRK00_02620 [Thermoprotei archaeon]